MDALVFTINLYKFFYHRITDLQSERTWHLNIINTYNKRVRKVSRMDRNCGTVGPLPTRTNCSSVPSLRRMFCSTTSTERLISETQCGGGNVDWIAGHWLPKALTHCGPLVICLIPSTSRQCSFMPCRSQLLCFFVVVID